MKYSTPSYSPFCRICGKMLKIEEHRAQGIGPVCAKELMKGLRNFEENNGQVFDIDLDTSEGVSCFREYDGDTLHFSIEQRVVKHSPTGMEWGYAGSGPADFALNILLHYTDPAAAIYLYQSFKHSFVARLPREGGTILAEDIRKWLLEKTNTEAAQAALAKIRNKSETLFTEELDEIADALHTS